MLIRLIQRGIHRVSIVLLAVMTPSTAIAGWMGIPETVPVDRIVHNLEQRIADHPDDFDARYNLARAHSLAFVLRTGSLSVVRDRQTDTPSLWTEWYIRSGRWKPTRWPTDSDIAEEGDQIRNADAWGWRSLPVEERPQIPRIDKELAITHLRRAIEEFNELIEAFPMLPEYRLGLAYVLDHGSEHAVAAGVIPTNAFYAMNSRGAIDNFLIREFSDEEPEFARQKRIVEYIIRAGQDHPRRPFERDQLMATVHDAVAGGRWEDRRAYFEELIRLDWNMQCLEHYFSAFSLALPQETRYTTANSGDITDGRLVILESADRYKQVAERLGSNELVRQKRIAIMAEAVRQHEAMLPSMRMTPMIVPVDRRRSSFNRMVARDHAISFDLDGTGLPQRWDWITPDAALLVWDPERAGNINSGMQLFGNASWWMFFADGYRALDALDDDRDGVLRGDELTGIRLWIDLNSNGVSEPGEVVDLEEFGIVGIATRPTGIIDGGPAHDGGIEYADGSSGPSYDWIAKSASEAVGDEGRED